MATGDQLPHLLEVPTGAGKTAAAVLSWLWRRIHGNAKIRSATGRRLIFCLPMRSLVEQTQRATQEWLAALGLELDVHVLMGGAIARDWDDAPERDSIIIGTQDQLLSRALNRGYAMSRFRWPIQFGWLNNDCVWVMDEVQLMGSGLSTSAQLHAMRQQFGAFGPCHTMWMSATLARGSLDTVDLRRITLREQGLGAADRKALSKRLKAKKPLELLPTDPKKPLSTAKQLLALHKAGSLTVVVVNRVTRARELAQALSKAANGTLEVTLIHSRFRPHERSEAQRKALQPGWSGILVATQAIEAGVDIDARILVTELASWPSLVQRFGRCNRAGARKDAQVLWMDVASKDAAPYTAEALDLGRGRLRELDDVGPESLTKVGIDDARPALPVIRRKDLYSLFDTQSDLAGHDIDVSAFVRATEHDADVQVLWRTWEGAHPPDDAAAPRREELCRVPIGQLDTLISTKAPAWRWSSLRATWERVTSKRDLYPGLTLLMPVQSGGYSAAFGWTGDKRDIPPEVPLPSDAERSDADEGDPWTYKLHEYVELSVHSDDVVGVVAELQAGLGELALPWSELTRAARWHDLGKAHAAFQSMLTQKLEPDDERRDKVWAKSDWVHSGRCERPHFRHELASALAFLDQGGSDLEVYLVAAHHGKVRMAVRSRPGEPAPKGEPNRRYALGVWDRDPLPRVELGSGVVSTACELDLSGMELGWQDGAPSWTERSLSLLDEHGPFRLAYLEALVRIADWRGTRKRANSKGRGGHA
ncbi:CRISPR-associated helicase Cas3 [Enhygromyxa salina]|uniref:CRISPR-associated helicase Cas3 n=1 Tax=Enhygromyxa salina TaxID=215803 RepID=A0A0C2D6W3_9BACT|nr:CRISPR-associated helicase Cas3 [Enhygromyxa salina]